MLGVFVAFTLAQVGMIRHWLGHREDRWRRRMAINTVGATLTGLVTVIVVVTKFTSGAWAVVVLIPILMSLLFWIRRHYRISRERLEAGLEAELRAEPPANRVALYSSGTEEARRYARWYAERIAAPTGPEVEVIEEAHEAKVVDEVRQIPRGAGTELATVVIPETVDRRSLRAELGTRLRLKHDLLDEPGIAIADAVWIDAPGGEPEPLPKRLVCRVLVSDVHAASMRALRYARALGIEDTRAVFVDFCDGRAEKVQAKWAEHGIPEELEMVDAPHRDLGVALSEHFRGLTADGETAVAVVMHQLRVHGAARLLHNQAAVYVKRVLLFEPRLVVTTVPYRLD